MTALEIAGSLSEAQRKLIPHMSDGEMVYPVANTAADAGVPVKEARKAFREMRALGIAQYGTLFNEDEGHPCGSGTWLNRLGLEVRSLLKDNSDANG